MRRGTTGRRRFVLYVGGVSVAGIVSIALAALDAQAPLTGSNPAAFWLYAGCVLLCELTPVKALRRHHGEFTASWTFSIALMLSAPLLACLLVLATTSVIGDAVNRKTPLQIVFNAAQLCVALSLGAGFLWLSTDGRPLVEHDAGLWPYLPLALLAGGIVYAANNALTMTVIALDQQVAVLPMLRRGFTSKISTDIMLLGLAPIFVAVAERSLLLLPLLLLTAWAVYDSAARGLARQHEALHDALTGLPNRRLFDQRVAQAMAVADKRGTELAVMLVDLDGFKETNDRLGHHVGDAVLQVVAERFQHAVRPQDLVARLGGDEFAILLHGAQGESAALRRADALQVALESPCVVQGFPVRVRGSFGVAVYPDHAADADALLRAADQAMYRAKARQLGVALYIGDRDGDAHGRVSLLSDLREAIEGKSLTLAYQPKLRLHDRRITGAEALLRWNHATLGPISPADFMPLAEQTELMPQLTELVLRSALTQNAQWRAAGLELDIAINGSARNLVDGRFVGVVAQALADAGVPAAALEIELTEHTVMSEPRRTCEVMTDLRAMGVRVSIDDFGTGFSSITSLRDLPIDCVKLDQTFVTSMTSTPRDLHIVQSILSLAGGLGLETIAEGVESHAVLEALDELGCDKAQGFLIARPLAAQALTELLLDRRDGLRVLPAPGPPVLRVAGAAR